MSDCTLTQKDNTGKNFSDCNFSGQDLSGYIFKSCTLTGTNFSGCKFDTATDFTGALFGKSPTNQPTSFSGCDLTAPIGLSNFGRLASASVLTNLTNTILPWALLGKQFQYVDITGAQFTNMPDDLSQLMLTSVKWNNFNFQGKNLTTSHFMNCDLTNCVMTGSNLNYASFIQVTNLTGVQMNNCSLYHTVFDGSTMTNTDLSYSTNFDSCSFLNTLLKGTKFDGNDLQNSKFSVPDKTSTDPAYITSFQFATISTDFLMNNLQKNWQCADFRNVRVPQFSSIVDQLYNLQAQNSFFNNTLSFENARLNGSNFTSTVFNGVNFNNALLNNVSMVDAKTVKGNEMGKRGAIFSVAQNNSVLAPPNDYSSFLTDLNSSNTSAVIAVFAYFGYTIGNISITSITDPVSKNPAWQIADTLTVPHRTFMVVKSPLVQDATRFELLSYDNSSTSFRGAALIGSYMESCDISNTVMKNAQLFGSYITYATLANVDLTGAQLGDNAAVFSLAQTDATAKPPYDYTSFLSDLQTPNLANIVDVFGHYGYTIGNITFLATTPPAGADLAWQVKDNQISPARSFAVTRNITQQSPLQYELDVFFDDALPATLDNSYMPGIILSQANLTGCSLIGCHLYNNQVNNSYSTLDHATLVEVRFDNSNLYKADFTSAVLSGASFSGANLMGANFKGVTLDATSVGHKVLFESANLQGADFSASVIKSANFLNAAICVPVNDNLPDTTNGVWLYSVPAGNQNFAVYLNELNSSCKSYSIEQPPPSVLSKKMLLQGIIQPLMITYLQKLGIQVSTTANVSVNHMETTWQIVDTDKTYDLIPGYDGNSTVAYNVYQDGAATAICSLDYNTALLPGIISAALINTLKTASSGSINLSASAFVSVYQRPTVWTIFDPVNNNTSYTVWWGVQLGTGVNPKLTNVTNVRSSLTNLTTLFARFGMALRPQTLVTQATDAATNTITWTIDMGKQDAYNLSTGYILCKIVGSPATAPTQLDIYGYTMRMMGIGNNQQQMIQDFDCQVTKISETVMDDSTLLPNSSTKLQNTTNNLRFNQWVKIYTTYPSPPNCVPTGLSYCPRPVSSTSIAAIRNA